MTMAHFELYAVPAWALCYLINGDPTGLYEDDITQADNWMKKEHIAVVCPPEEEQTDFNAFPSFGLPCATYNCSCLVTD